MYTIIAGIVLMKDNLEKKTSSKSVQAIDSIQAEDTCWSSLVIHRMHAIIDNNTCYN